MSWIRFLFVGVFFVVPHVDAWSNGPAKLGGHRDKAVSALAFSPDGKWLAYVSNSSGRMEVYLRSIDGADRYPVSTTGGLHPLWSRDGHEIFYVTGADRLMSVAVRFPAEPVLAQPVELFRIQLGNDGARPYDVEIGRAHV